MKYFLLISVYLPSPDSRRADVILAKECAYLLVNCLTKPAQENVWLGKLTAFDMTLMG